jgi:general secretion pathway protein N
MHARRRLIVAAVLTFLLGLLILFPARVAYRWFAPPAAAFSGIDGSVWYGSARQVSVNGVYLRDLSWRIKPQSLVTGKLNYAVEATPASGFIEGDVGIGIGGKLTFSNVNAALPLAALETATRMRGLRGNASIQIERLEISDGVPVAADGKLTVSNLVAPRVYRGSIGGYSAEFFTQNNGVVASVEDTDGLLDIAGSLQLGSDRTYQFIAKIAPKANTPDSVERQLRVLGSADERGQRELRLEGQL